SADPWTVLLQVASFVLNLLALLTGLVLSFVAVVRVSRADNEAMEQYPEWDRAMAAWNQLYYCLRDNVAIDPEQNRDLSEDEFQALTRTRDQPPRTKQPLFTHGDIHPPATTHKHGQVLAGA